MKIFGLIITRISTIESNEKAWRGAVEEIINERNALRRENARLSDIEAAYKRLTDRDEKGRFVKNEKN